jgi:hypothetical protein
MNEIKSYRPKGRFNAFRYDGPDNMPPGWKIDAGPFDYAIAPDSFYVSIERGQWLVYQDGIWCGVPHEDFVGFYEECES